LIVDPLPGLTAAGDDTLHIMAGLVPAIPIGRELRFSDRDHRHEAGDDVRGFEARWPKP
jgi:hypothetical protein